jgi:hypothetical protein
MSTKGSKPSAKNSKKTIDSTKAGAKPAKGVSKAKNTATKSAQSTEKAAPGKPWAKGQSGNPGGRPKLPAGLREAAQALSIKALDVLESIMCNEDAQESARVKAATAIWDRGWGKPEQPIDVNSYKPIVLNLNPALLADDPNAEVSHGD